MELAKVQISGVHAIVEYCKPIPAGIIGAEVCFDFPDKKWEKLQKTAVFRGVGTKDVFITGNTAVIPAEVISRPGVLLSVGVYGSDAENTIAIPTLWADLGTVRNAADPSGDKDTDPALPVWAQLREQIEELKKKGTDSETNREDGEDGGYYTPVVTQPDDNTLQFDFTPSDPEMPAMEPVLVELPVQNSGGNADQSQIEKAVSDYLEKNPPVVSGSVTTVINQNGGGVLKIWAGTRAEYDALLIKDEGTVYLIDGATSSGGSNSDSGGGGEDSGDSGDVVYGVTNNLVDVTLSNSATTVDAGSAYTATLTPTDGYEISEVAVYMGGEDITASAYVSGVINIARVTGSIVITASALPIPSGVGTYTFTNIVAKKIDDTGALVDSGQTKTADEFIPVTSAVVAINTVSGSSLAGVVTTSQYDSDKIFLGNCANAQYIDNENTRYVKVAFGASSGAVALVRMCHVQSVYWTEENSTLNSSGEYTDETGQYGTDYHELTGDEGVLLLGGTTATTKIAYYDESKTFISREYKTAGNTFALTIPENAKYYRISGSTEAYSNLPISGVN